MNNINNLISKPLQTIIFDLDGTLVDSARDITFCVNQMLDRIELAPLDVPTVITMIGDGMARLVEQVLVHRMGPDISDETRQHALDLYRQGYHTHRTTPAILYPGIITLMTQLHMHGMRVGLCTNKPQIPALLVLEDTGLSPYFHHVTGGDVLPIRKPDGGHLQHVLDQLGEPDPQAVLMVGDSMNDLLAARAVGCDIALYRHGYAHSPVDDMGADFMFDHHDQLAAYIADRCAQISNPA